MRPFPISKRYASTTIIGDKQGFRGFFPAIVKEIQKTNGIVIEKAALDGLWMRAHQHDFVSSRPRWFADCKARLGKCIMFGIPFHDGKQQQQQQQPLSHYQSFTIPGLLIKSLARQLGPQWKSLVSGHEGFQIKDIHQMSCPRVNWGDLDSMGHVNNVTHIRWAESARMEWVRRFALAPSDCEHSKQWNELWTPKGQGLILKSIKMDYKLPLTYPDTVTTIHKLRSLPSPTDNSFMLDVMILSNRHQRIAARGEEEIVMYDYKKLRKTQIAPFMMEAFTKTWADQEEKKTDAAVNAFRMELRLMVLEKLTWDRQGAVEDFGVSNSEG